MKNKVKPDKPHMTIKYIKRALYVGCYKQALRISNNYCSSLATVIARTRLNVALYVHCLFFIRIVTLREWIVTATINYLLGNEVFGLMHYKTFLPLL